jgi:hypothetical protein
MHHAFGGVGNGGWFRSQRLGCGQYADRQPADARARF